MTSIAQPNNSKTINPPRLSIAAALCAAISLGGCPTQPDPTDPSGNDTIANATAIDLGNDDRAEFTGTIGETSDTDVFNLGTLEPGDVLYVDVQALDPGLDPVAAIFDQREYVHAFNDDRTPDASNLNPLIDVVVRGPAGPYYLGITPFPDSTVTGDYRVTVRVTRDAGQTIPDPQIVYLNWAGGSGIVVKNVGTYNLDPFDATDLDPTFAGQTDAMKDRIQQEIAQCYDGFNLILLNSDDDEPAGEFSTVHFGGDDSRAFAIAEQVDTQNADQGDDAIIFCSSFRNAFSHTPTFGEMANAVSNTAAHEVGHLLGLVHTASCASLMDSTCGNDSILFEQAFQSAPLANEIFPFGFQDAEELLEWTIGLVSS